MTPELKQLLVVLGAAVATVVVADLAIQRVCPLLPRRIEADDGIAQVAAGDPETLLVGSSHSRGFVGVAGEVARISGGRRQMIPVAVEYGKISSYEWLLDHRLLPLLDAKRPDGTPARPSLRRFVLITEWWDMCSPETDLADNVPARLFTLGDFTGDVAKHGLTAWNLTWVDYETSKLFRSSILYQDRGVWRAPGAIVNALRHRATSPGQAEKQLQRVQAFQGMVERGATDPHCHDGRERAALTRVLDWAQRRGLDTTLLLVPRRPDTLTPIARATTLAAFSREMQDLAHERAIRFFDYTTSSPLESDDFMADLDHVSATGNAKFTAWSLENGLGFLLQPPEGAGEGGSRP